MSNKLSTKDVKVGGNGMPKTMQPGNQLAKINSVELETFRFVPGGYHFLLHLEGEDLGSEFEGFWLDKDRHELGKHKGQVGRVKASQWAFADGYTPGNVPISRDQEILKFMKSLCIALGKDVIKWFDDQNNKHETIESLVVAFNNDKPYKDIYLEWCIGGKEYEKGGYTNYDMFLPKFVKGQAPFKNPADEKTVLIKYDATSHLKKKDVKPVEKFGEENNTATGEVANEFKL